jgi:hypothetical protein
LLSASAPALQRTGAAVGAAAADALALRLAGAGALEQGVERVDLLSAACLALARLLLGGAKRCGHLIEGQR